MDDGALPCLFQVMAWGEMLDFTKQNTNIFDLQCDINSKLSKSPIQHGFMEQKGVLSLL